MPIKTGYKIVMSRGDDIPIDPDELKKVDIAIEAGQPAKLKRGYFNPSFFVSIVEDAERKKEFLGDLSYKGEKERTFYLDRGMLPLKDIFKEKEVAKKLTTGKK